MTALQITPNWKNKTAKFKGTIAAGEHVAVSIANDDNFIADTTNLRLRVVNPANGKTLAQFPMPETADDETDGENEVLPSSEIPAEGEVDWASDLTPLSCILNLNTAQMLKAVPPAANVPLLFVLDAYKEASDGEPGEFTLYFKDMCEVTHWPRRTGEEQPVNLDDYKDLIEDFNTRLTDAEQTVVDAAANAQSAANSASAAAQSAAAASTAATDAQTGAIASKNAAQSAATAAATSATNASTAAANAAQAASGAQTAQSAAEAAAARAEAALPLDTTLSLVGKAADAKSVGDALTLKADKSDTYTKSETDGKVADEAQARTLLAATVQTNAETIAAHTSSLASLSSRVGDNETAIANRYTKGEVDAKVAGVQTFQKLVVNELPSAEAADYKTIYLVPRAGSETPDLCDEYVTVGAAGSRRWEKIGGGTAVDITLDDAVTRTSTNGVKSSGIWSAIWGALTALPGVSSLYDWCVAQLAGKAPATNIAKSALAQGVQASLDKADTALRGVKLNGAELAPDANRNVDITNIPKAALATALQNLIDGALQKTGGTMTGDLMLTDFTFALDGDPYASFTAVEDFIAITVGGDSSEPVVVYIPLFRGDIVGAQDMAAAIRGLAPLASPAFTGAPTAPTPASGDNSTKVATTAFVQSAIGGITPGPDNNKLNSTAAAPAFSTSATYAVGDYVTYQGDLYVCSTAVSTAGDWTGSTNWTAANMTDPDAVLDITSQNQLRVVAKDGTLLWAQGYALASASSATLACDAVNNFTFADGATSQAFALPTAPTGKVGDFVLDIDNSANTGAATMTLTGLDKTFSVVVQEGENLNDMQAIAAGELARFYITLTTFRVNNLPTWHIVKQVVENGGATA